MSEKVPPQADTAYGGTENVYLFEFNTYGQ